MNTEWTAWHRSEETFTAVRSNQDHLSVWPSGRELPDGWTRVSPDGTFAESLGRVEDLASGSGAGRGCDRGATCAHGPGITELFAASVARHGDRPAVSDDRRSLTYRELAEEADSMAALLRGRGVSTEDRVAVYLPRGVDVFVTLLAVLKAGAAYVPVDTRYPDAHRDLMIRSSGARLVVTVKSLLPGIEPTTVDVLTVDDPTPPAVEPTDGVDVAGCQAACVLFTSGSSGTPKAIVLEHRNLRYLAANASLPPLLPEDRVGHLSSLSFDAFTFETWCTLAAGGEIVVLPTMPDLVAGDVQRDLRKHRITALLAPTMAVNHVMREDREAFASLRVLHTGGDVILASACRALLQSSFKGAFYNLYGPTEGTTACTAWHVTDVGEALVDVPIGRALSGAAVYLLDRDRRPVADGDVGELFIGGDGVARGYLGQPGLTASRFLPDPFAAGFGRMYATGDLARRCADGVLEFVGRLDDQVKVRGYRVEPREVERMIGALDRVHDVAVVVDGEADGKHLVALVAGDPGLSLRDLRCQATAVLPDYLVPSVFTMVDRIPANDHGKRNGEQLMVLARSALARRRHLVSPRDDVERHLARWWEDLLGVEVVGVDDDFFALGGNSLLAFRLRRRIQKELGATLTTEEVLTVTVLKDLARLVGSREGGQLP